MTIILKILLLKIWKMWKVVMAKKNVTEKLSWQNFILRNVCIDRFYYKKYKI